MQVHNFLENSAARLPEKTALVCGKRRYSYLKLDRWADAVATTLVDQGVRRGDRVAVCLDNSVETVVSIFGTLKAGAAFMPLNPTVKGEKLTFILKDSEARALITSGRKTREAADSLLQVTDLSSLLLVERGGAESCPEPLARRFSVLVFEDIPVEPGAGSFGNMERGIDLDLAALIYTSGSTGNPKGVMMTHLNMASAAHSITTYLENREDDVILNLLPLSFDYGLYQVLMAFKFGGTVVLERSLAYPFPVVQTLMHEQVTGFPIVPTILSILFRLDLSRYSFPHLRYITNTGAALPTPHIEKLRRYFPKVQIFSMYGLTECKRVSYLPPAEIDARPRSVGKAMPNVEVFVLDDRGQPVGPGVVGELVVRGSNVMKGYWKRPDETRQVLRPGRWPGESLLYTGDLFSRDDEGFLYFHGRKDDIIKTRGEKVSPKEVENVLYSMPDVVDAAVVGIPDEVLGTAVKAILSVADGTSLTESQVLQFCADRLEDYMVPKSVEFRSSLPKTGSGKIDKRALDLSEATE